jgi:putative transposase
MQLPENQRKDLISELWGKKGKLVEIISFALLPNHFHLLLRQSADNGISTFMRLAINSWTRYFNTKHNRPGALFQGVFKAVHIETDEQLIHLSRYIHLNPLLAFVVKEKDFLSYPWSSLSDYINGKSSFVDLDTVLSYFPSLETYRKFVCNQIDYARELEKIKHLTIEKE